MDWETYKSLSHSPPYFTRWALAHTVPYLNGTTLGHLERCQAQRPLTKPADHKGGPETDVLRLELSGECVREIIEALETGRVEGKLTAGSSQPNLGTLIKRWEEYEQWLCDDSS